MRFQLAFEESAGDAIVDSTRRLSLISGLQKVKNTCAVNSVSVKCSNRKERNSFILGSYQGNKVRLTIYFLLLTTHCHTQ